MEMARRWIVCIASLLLLLTITNAELEESASWRFLTFAPPPGYPGASPYGFPVYSPNAIFTGFHATEDRFFLSLPRFQPGQPITLGWVPRPQPGSRLPLDTPINPFPDWEWHRAAANGAASAASNCSALVSVFRTRMDRCGRLWVLDSGVSDTLSTFSVSCLPKLLVFNATTGQVLRRVEFRPEVLRVNSLLTNLVLDSRSPPGSSCHGPDDLFIYLSDTTAPGLVVYDVGRDSAWRYSAPQMFPDPDKGIFKVAGESFMLMDGIIGLALSNPVLLHTYRPDTLYSERLLYFQAFASDRIYSVPTSALRTQPKDNEELPIKLVGHKSSQAAPLLVDPKDDSLIFSPVSETAIASWQPTQNILGVKAYNPSLLQFVLDLFIEPDQIWAISTRFQKFFRRTVTAEEVNLRILRIDNAPQYPFH